jgi:hypothetical protein
MKKPTTASLKKVTPENLVALGAERLAELLVAAAEVRPELKRRLRMELAAEQGAEHLAAEIDKRLGSLETSRGKVSWRQRPTFVRDLDGLRVLIAERLAGLDRATGLRRLWLFMDVARRVGLRVRDRDGELGAVFDRAASDIGRLARETDTGAVADAVVRDIVRWKDWLPVMLAAAPPGLAAGVLRELSAREGASVGWMPILRQLADAAGDVDSFWATFTAPALRDPSMAAELARRLLERGRVTEARRVLENAAPAGPKGGLRIGKATPPEIDFDWETQWIEYLEQSGRASDAQAARWKSFERTLSAERARAFARRLGDFEDVEAEDRAFALAAAHPDIELGLRFLLDWPALPAAARMIATRADELRLSAEVAESWASKLRVRQPAAAEVLLRRSAAAAFRRGEFKTAERLTQEADAINSQD